MIISLLNQKGGVGKTTLSVNIAGFLAETGKKVLLIDADEQHSALDWAAVRVKEPKFRVVGMPKPIIHREIKFVKDDYDYIIIDGTPRMHDVTRSAVSCSNVVLIPVTPSPYDIWSSDDTINLVKQSIEDFKVFFVINRKIMGTRIGNDTNEALKKYDIPKLENEIAQRVIFGDAAKQGLTVPEFEPNHIASIEIEALVNEIIRKVG